MGEEIRMQFKNKFKECRNRIKIMNVKRDEASIQQLRVANIELSNIPNQQEAYQNQRAKQFWLVVGDANTKYFHQFVSSKKQKNSFDKLKDEHDQWHSWENRL